MKLLPPLQAAARSLAFASSLASRRPAQRALEPLGHDVAADGPGGLLFGIATPLPVTVTADAATARLATLADMPMRRTDPPPVEAPRGAAAAAPRRVPRASPSVAAPVEPEAREPAPIATVDHGTEELLPVGHRAGHSSGFQPPDAPTRALPADEAIVRSTLPPTARKPRDDAPDGAVPAPGAAAPGARTTGDAGRPPGVRAPRNEARAPNVLTPRDEVPPPNVRAVRDGARAPRKDAARTRAGKDEAPAPRAVEPTDRAARGGAPPARAPSEDVRVTRPLAAVDKPSARITPRGHEPHNARRDDPPARTTSEPQVAMTTRDDAQRAAEPPATTTRPLPSSDAPIPPFAQHDGEGPTAYEPIPRVRPRAEPPARTTRSSDEATPRMTAPDQPRVHSTRPLRGVGEPFVRTTPRDDAPPARQARGDQPPPRPARPVIAPAGPRGEASVHDEAAAPPAAETSAARPNARPAGLGAPIVPRPEPSRPRPPLRRPVPAVQRAEPEPRRLPATDPAPEAPPRPLAAAQIRTLLGARGLHVQRSSEPVPADVRTSLEPQLGVELSSLRVHRGQESSQMAEALNARAFTVGGEVHVPASQGSLSTGSGRALLAHELVHVAQQRTLGPNVPDEGSPAGRQLENEARAMEQTWLAPARVVPSVPLLSRANAPVATPAPAPTTAEPTEASAAPSDALRSPQHPVPAPAPAGPDIEQLTANVYDRVRSLLRTELRVDRERAGLFTDVR